jgi:simple sugar transport system substrate-binding protein
MGESIQPGKEIRGQKNNSASCLRPLPLATNPAVVRAAVLAVAGTDPGHAITVSSVLMTRKGLAESGLKTVEELSAKIPSFGSSSAAKAAWIPE